jgi:hypothetical protein
MYDYTDFGGCSEECPLFKLGDHHCDYACNNEACLYDLGD